MIIILDQWKTEHGRSITIFKNRDLMQVHPSRASSGDESLPASLEVLDEGVAHVPQADDTDPPLLQGQAGL
jgi:hypothetical protein